MEKPKSVTETQLTMSIGTSIIGVGILAFPRITVEYVQTGAPLAAMFAMLLMVTGGVILAYLGNKYRNQTIFEYADQLVGKGMNTVLLILVSAYFVELTALASREFGEVVVTSVLQRTPLAVTVFVMVLLATIACRADMAVFARILTFYMPFVYFPALVIVVLSLKSAHLTNIMPLWALFHHQRPQNVILSVMVVAALFTNYMIVGLLTPFMYRPSKAMMSTVIGIGFAGILYVILMYATLSVFGIEEIQNLLWPTLELAKTAALPAFFIERIDPIFLAVWVTAVFSAIFAAYYLAVHALSHMLRLSNHRSLSVLLLPIILLLAIQPSNIVAMYQTIKVAGMIGLVIGLAYPLLLLVVHLFRGALRSGRS